MHINYIELSDINQEIINKINIDDINEEEKEGLRNLLLRNKNLFFVDGNNLTSTHEIKHAIIINQDTPINSKS